MTTIDLSKYATEDLKSLYSSIQKEINKRSNQDRSHKKGVIRRILRIHETKPKNHVIEDEEIERIRLFNSHWLASIPFKTIPCPHNREPYLSSLLLQDWRHLYQREIDHGEYYVYAHVDPRLKVFVTTEDAGGNYGGKPFYIGKGTGNRAYDLKRNEGHGKTIKEVIRAAYSADNIVRILFSNLSEQKALEIESKLIYFFGTQFSVSKKGWLVNLSEPAIPEFETKMEVIPLKLEDLPTKEKNLSSKIKSQTRKDKYLKIHASSGIKY
jgi:hypothetical protein